MKTFRIDVDDYAAGNGVLFGRVAHDEAIAATGFRTPLGDLPGLGVKTVAQGRIPALSPYWETTVPGIFLAGNASQGAPELRKYGFGSASTSVKGFRYNARLLARHAEARFSLSPPSGLDARTLRRALPLQQRFDPNWPSDPWKSVALSSVSLRRPF